jgi:hypothetical protein
MSEAPVRVNRRLEPRYVVYRDCAVVFRGTSTDVTLLNVSRSGIAILGSLTAISPGDRVEIMIEGFFLNLEAIVCNVNYGRIGAKFDLVPAIAAAWQDEFEKMIAAVSPMP